MKLLVAYRLASIGLVGNLFWCYYTFFHFSSQFLEFQKPLNDRLPIGFDRISWKPIAAFIDASKREAEAYRLASIGLVGNYNIRILPTSSIESIKTKAKSHQSLGSTHHSKAIAQLNQRRSLFVSDRFTSLLNCNILKITLVRSYLLPELIIQSFEQLERSASQKPTDSAPFV